MRATLTTRLVAWVGVPTALVLGFVVWNASRRSFDRVAAQAEELSRQLAHRAAAHLETRLNTVHKIPEMIGQVLETGRFDTRSIQMSLVPKKFPAFPERRELEIHALLRPAREVGGDLCDFYFLDDDWLCFLIGDVSGKGVPAALFMAVTKTLLKASSSRRRPMSQMIRQVNDELCTETDSGMFVSLLYGHLDVRTGEVELTNAGHPAPYLLAARDHAVRALEGRRNVALGARSGLEYHPSTHRLAPGDTLFFFTDGVTEALDSADHFYGAARLESALREAAALPVEKITRAVVHEARAFSGEREQSDDISVLAVRWLGPAGIN